MTIAKAFAAYNMVILYGGALLKNGLVSGPPNAFENASLLFRSLIAMSLPILAGVYWRHRFGALIENAQLRFGLVVQGFQFLLIAVVLEFIRISMTTLAIDGGFTWHALHFIALAMLVQTSLSLLPTTARRVVTLTLCLVSVSLPLWWQSEIMRLKLPDNFSLELTAVLWFFALGALVYWFVASLRPWIERSRGLALYRQLLLSCCLGVLLFYFRHREYLIAHPRALISFISLPVAIWLPLTGDHFWSFFSFYPLFAFGVFFRSSIASESTSESKSRTYLTILVLAGAAAWAIARNLQAWMLDPGRLVPDVNHEISFGYLVVSAAAFCALFFISLQASEIQFGRVRLGATLERIASELPSPITLYVLTPFIFVTAREIAGVGFWQRWPFWLAVHVLYIFTLLASYLGSYLLKRSQTRERRETSFRLK